MNKKRNRTEKIIIFSGFILMIMAVTLFTFIASKG